MHSRNTVLLGFLLPWTCGIFSRLLLQQSTAAAPYLGRGVSPHWLSPRPWAIRLVSLITRTTALSNSVKLSHAMWGHPRLMGHGREVWQNVVHWLREWKTTSVFLPWEPHEQLHNRKSQSCNLDFVLWQHIILQLGLLQSFTSFCFSVNLFNVLLRESESWHLWLIIFSGCPCN